jgi:hypothetical protein
MGVVPEFNPETGCLRRILNHYQFVENRRGGLEFVMPAKAGIQ